MKTTLEKLVEMYSDSKLSPGEIVAFRKLADKATIDLLQLNGDQGVNNALCKSFEVTNQLLQSTFLKLKRETKNQDSRDVLANVVFAQVELLKANITLFGKIDD